MLRFLFFCYSSLSLIIEAQSPTKAMVTGTTGTIAIEQGLLFLKSGGSAIDAAISTALTQIVLCGGSWVSLAGVINIIYYDAKSKQIFDLNGNYNTILNEIDPLTIPKAFDPTKNDYGRTVLVPGFMASVAKAHDMFGKLPFAQLFDKAIELAGQGIPWSYALDYMFKLRNETLLRTEAGRKIFLKPDGSNYKVGDNFVQNDLAETLRKLAKEGPKYMYEGDWAQKMVTEVQNMGGKITLQDLSNYSPLITDPLKWNSEKNNITLYTHNNPSRGGIDLIQALNLIEESGILDYGEGYTESSEVMGELISILNLVELKYFNYTLSRKMALDISENKLDRKFNREIWQKVLNGDFSQNREPIVNLVQQENISLDLYPKHSDAIVVFDEESIIFL